jgi:hypothetical protein
MKVLRVGYLPELEENLLSWIRTNVNPDMIADGDIPHTAQYDTSVLIGLLQEDNEPEWVEKIKKLDVDFIEIKF